MSVLTFFKTLLGIFSGMSNNKPEPRHDYFLTKQIELPDIKHRFPNNKDLQDRFDEIGFLDTISNINRLNCELTDADWKLFKITELEAIIYTQGNDLHHWKEMHHRALREITERAESLKMALFIYEKYSCVQGICGGNCFENMFTRIVKLENKIEKRLLIWEEICEKTDARSSIYSLAKESILAINRKPKAA